MRRLSGREINFFSLIATWLLSGQFKKEFKFKLNSKKIRFELAPVLGAISRPGCAQNFNLTMLL